MVAKMLTKATFLLLAIAVIQVLSEYIEPKYFEDLIEEASQLPALRPRIVSGWDAIPGQHPHQAHLRIERARGFAMTCGGSFVHREWLITAAHCSALSINIMVRGGSIDLRDPTPEYLAPTTQYWTFPTFDDADRRRVQPNDISIVKLEQPITITRNLKPIRIQPSVDANRSYEGIRLYASGFGVTWSSAATVPSCEINVCVSGAESPVLQWVYLRGVSDLLCRRTFGTSIATEATICAQWFNVTSQSTCLGDNGGPLVYTNPEGERILVGVTSHTTILPGGCHSGVPAAFIRPGHFHDWFTEVSGIDFENLDEDEDKTTTAPSTTVPPTTVPPTTVPPTTPEGDIDDKGSDEDDTSEEDEHLPELLKRLLVKVKVKVNVNQSRMKVRVVKKIQ